MKSGEKIRYISSEYGMEKKTGSHQALYGEVFDSLPRLKNVRVCQTNVACTPVEIKRKSL
jgi:hypothetical protein